MSALPKPQAQRRPMGLPDLDAVTALEARAYSFPWSRGNFIDSLSVGHLAEVLQAPRPGLLGYFIAMPGVDELHLLNLTVAPEWQGRGLGSELLQAVCEHAVARGMAQLWLEVRQSNQRARSLYRHRGFQELGLRRGYYPAAAGREDAVIMSLKLPGHALD